MGNRKWERELSEGRDLEQAKSRVKLCSGVRKVGCVSRLLLCSCVIRCKVFNTTIL